MFGDATRARRDAGDPGGQRGDASPRDTSSVREGAGQS
jgi:hypothetical protein